MRHVLYPALGRTAGPADSLDNRASLHVYGNEAPAWSMPVFPKP